MVLFLPALSLSLNLPPKVLGSSKSGALSPISSARPVSGTRPSTNATTIAKDRNAVCIHASFRVSVSCSIGLGSGTLDHIGPSYRFFPDMRAELLRRPARYDQSQLGQLVGDS